MSGLPGQSNFAGLHAAWFVFAALATAFLYFRPRPRLALLIVIAMHGLAFLGYYGNLARPYAIGVGSDRAILVQGSDPGEAALPRRGRLSSPPTA